MEIRCVRDLIHALNILGDEVVVGPPAGKPDERLRSGLLEVVGRTMPTRDASDVGQVTMAMSGSSRLGPTHLVVKATPRRQRVVADQIAAWRVQWSACWPDVFASLRPVEFDDLDPLQGLEVHSWDPWMGCPPPASARAPARSSRETR